MNTALVVFDIAGTTVLDKGDVNEAFRMAFTASGIEVDTPAINKVMGYRKIEAVEIILDQFAPGRKVAEPELVATIHDVFTQNMGRFYENDDTLQPLPHVMETFEWLQSKGIKITLDTGFTRIITDAILKKLNWDKHPHINAVICSDEVPQGRPHPYMIQSLMQQTGITDPARVVKVGDTEVDIQEGRNANCGLVVAVTTGAYAREALIPYKPDYIIDSMQELIAKIQ
ncbi:MAG: HAD hydrolase-like protein [Sediminibacterium magnilacihabitans]|jgi:phosphonatase-like hydrolase|nr:HAD hydrolase-like protein [Sediminibacterium magnilacihabitans]PQV62290.1 phosphonatase-like hydrolase [Sediminibacterium magnilacihabitans]